MANNRMLLVHRPTGLAVVLGKHMGTGWYAPPSESLMKVFYDRIEKEVYGNQIIHGMEDMCIAMESCSADTPYVLVEWDGYFADKEDERLTQIWKTPPLDTPDTSE